jgi:hypothetical protein
LIEDAVTEALAVGHWSACFRLHGLDTMVYHYASIRYTSALSENAKAPATRSD